MAPIKGVRIPVKLPWKGATNNEDQFVSMKDSVAKFLGFDKATRAELTYEVKVQKKDKNGEKVSGTATVKRRRRPGFRQRAIRVVFQIGKKGKTTGKKVSVGGQSVATLQFPITTSVPIEEVISFFETGAGKNLGALKVVDANSGQGYPVIR